MAFGSIEITTITRAQDYAAIKHNEDNKGVVDQTNIGHQMHKDAQQRTTQVRSSDNSEWQNKKFDAKDKGQNEYQGSQGKGQKQEEKKEKVIQKGHSGFDIKI